MISDKDIHILTDLLEETKVKANAAWAIYGTGDGAEIIYTILCKLDVSGAIKSIIERDGKVFPDNKFHGQGFTEWTNTSRAVPLFTGHYQPHIPYDTGYYDLLNPSTFKRQIF